MICGTLDPKLGTQWTPDLMSLAVPSPFLPSKDSAKSRSKSASRCSYSQTLHSFTKLHDHEVHPSLQEIKRVSWIHESPIINDYRPTATDYPSLPSYSQKAREAAASMPPFWPSRWRSWPKVIHWINTNKNSKNNTNRQNHHTFK